jgi:predicted nuclease with TOPRIM domain
MVTNQTVIASTSLTGALAAIDAALQQCQERIQNLEREGRTRLDVYTTLVEKYDQLRRRRRELQGVDV